MDRAMELRHLEQADRHIATGKRLISEQEDRIADLDRTGRDTTKSRTLLDSFYAIQVLHIQHREMILKALEE